MTATITWAVESMGCYPQSEGQTDVVFNVIYTCSGVETINGVEYTFGTRGGAPVTYEAGSPYTPYDQLTQEQVLGWVFASIGEEGKAGNEAAVQAQIDAQANPPVVMPPLPWAEQPGS